MNNADTALFKTSWQRAWKGLRPAEGLMEQLLAAYSQPQRRYHTLQHLGECLTHFGAAQHLALHPAEVELALWFHDAVYDTRAQDNELRSAQWATRALQYSGASTAVQQRVYALIMATCHAATPEDADTQLLVDIDLAILGASAQRFAEYQQQVHAEYHWVPAPHYDAKRKQVLAHFLQRPQIYATPCFAQALEQTARENLRTTLHA